MLHQQTVDKDVTATDAAQEDQVNTVIEERDEFPWKEVVAGKDLAESVVLDESESTIPCEPCTQPDTQPDIQPDTQPVSQPGT